MRFPGEIHGADEDQMCRLISDEAVPGAYLRSTHRAPDVDPSGADVRGPASAARCVSIVAALGLALGIAATRRSSIGREQHSAAPSRPDVHRDLSQVAPRSEERIDKVAHCDAKLETASEPREHSVRSRPQLREAALARPGALRHGDHPLPRRPVRSGCIPGRSARCARQPLGAHGWITAMDGGDQP
jgi:hypothetical protein